MDWLVEMTFDDVSPQINRTIDDVTLPAGHVTSGGEGPRMGIVLRASATTAGRALAAALRSFRDSVGDLAPGEPVDVRISTAAEYDQRATARAIEVGELVSITEVAERLGVSQQRASQLAKSDAAFPPGEPVAGRTLFPRFLVDEYVEARKAGATKAPTGRPRKQAASREGAEQGPRRWCTPAAPCVRGSARRRRPGRGWWCARLEVTPTG